MFDRVGIIGLGLIGGSIGLALHKTKAARQVVGYDMRMGVGEQACAMQAIDVACTTLADVLQGTELVILATPVGAMHALLKAMGPLIEPGTVVTDVASTKAQVIAWAEELLPASVFFVGGHPMTGKEVSGVEVADATLFTKCLYCLTPVHNTQPIALNKVTTLVEVLGAYVHYVNPVEHDKQVANVSHLPFLASVAMMTTAAEDATWSDAALLAASGFRDMSRLAGGSPEMYRDICMTNSPALVTMLDAYIATLEQIRTQVRLQDKNILNTFKEAQQLRLQWQNTRNFTEGEQNP